jgi:putative FmdB family regulatory protein
MPLYPLLCRHCNRVFEFFYPRSDDPREPLCPQCHQAGMERQLSKFAFRRGGKNPLAAIPIAAESEVQREQAESEGSPARDEGLYKLWEHCRDGDAG